MKLLAILTLGAGLMNAEIVDSAASGFTVKTVIDIKSTPEEVYRRLVHNVGDWWDPAHTFSGDAHNLRIEDRPGGCYCEKLPDNGFVRHMEVIYAAPGKRLVLSGALGPMQNVAATGSMQIQAAAADGGTKLEVTYTVTGYQAKGMTSWAAPLDRVLGEQFTRLKNYVETGNPVAGPSK